MSKERDNLKLKQSLNKMIESLIKRQYIQKFLGFKRQISLKSVYGFLRKQGIRTYLKDDAEKINNRYKQLYFRVKNNKHIKELQSKYPTFKIAETYSFLVMEKHFKLTKNNVKNFEICILILTSKIAKDKNIDFLKKRAKELGIFFD